VKVYKLLLCFHDIFVPCVIQSFLSFILSHLTGKLADKNNVYFSEDTCTCIISRRILLRIRIFSNVAEKISTHILHSITYFLKSLHLLGNVAKYRPASQATDDNIIRRIRIACWIPKATDTHSEYVIDCVWNVMAHAQKPDFVFRWNGRIHLNRRGRQFGRLLAAEVCASAVVMLDSPCSEVVWRVLATHSIRQFPLHFPSRASPCAIRFQLDTSSTNCAAVYCCDILVMFVTTTSDLHVCII
jgi:hypothetical protein